MISVNRPLLATVQTAVGGCPPRAGELLDAAVAVGAGHDDEYVLAQFGHAVLHEPALAGVRPRLMESVLKALSSSVTAAAGPLAAVALHVATRPLESVSVADTQDLALHFVLRNRNDVPEKALCQFGMRSAMSTRSYKDKATISLVTLETMGAHTADSKVRAMIDQARQRYVNTGVARGREGDSSILTDTFPRIADYVEARERNAARDAAARRAEEIDRLAAGPAADAPKVSVEEGFVDLGGVRVPRRPR
jgi:hypothetical protein